MVIELDEQREADNNEVLYAAEWNKNLFFFFDGF